MKTASRKLTRGGAFILHNTKAHDIFTPEEFNEEQRMMREAIQEFVDRKVWPARKRFDNKDYDYTFELMRKIGEMGFLGGVARWMYKGCKLWPERYNQELRCSSRGPRNWHSPCFSLRFG